MSFIAKLTLAALLLLISGPSMAQRGNMNCTRRLALFKIAQIETGPRGYDYFLEFRNVTTEPVTVEIVMGNFGSDVTVDSLRTPGVFIGPREVKRFRIGTGRSDKVSAKTVRIMTDIVIDNGRPFITLQNCNFG